MKVYIGRYTTAVSQADELDEATENQINEFINCFVFQDSHVAIMRDAHYGEGSCIGFTAELTDHVIPNVVGVDIGCGVTAVPIPPLSEGEMHNIDEFIHKYIPHGFNVRLTANKLWGLQDPESVFTPAFYTKLQEVVERTKQEQGRVNASIGTLGGGNHFIEIDRDSGGQYWLVAHTGSRNFGYRVAAYHQKKARDLSVELGYKPSPLSCLPLENGGKQYLADMAVAQEYSKYNREALLQDILFFATHQSKLPNGTITSVHNYIDMKSGIIRKGAVSAEKGETVLIPLTGKDGIAFCKGKGSKRWNYSAPHGLGRIMSRTEARKTLNVEDYKMSMNGVISSTVCKNTLDEAPEAYKPVASVLEDIGECVEILGISQPLYNFKSPK